MKTPLILTTIILATAAVIGWKDHQRLASMRVAYKHAVTEATNRGIIVDSTKDDATIRVTKRARENREATARILASESIGLAKEREALRKEGKEPDVDFQQRELELQDRMKSLDPLQWELLIQEVASCTELNKGTRQAFLSNSITKFAYSHPEAALAFLAEAPDLFSGHINSEHLISTALTGWSRNDPMAAMEWVRKNGAVDSNLISEITKRGMISGAAARDPSIAFTLLGALDVDNPTRFVSEIIHGANTAEKQTATLTALRGYLAKIEDEESRESLARTAIGSLASLVTRDGFDTATRWISSAELTPEECVHFANGLPLTLGAGIVSKSEETGRWIEWVGSNLPAGNSDVSIRNIVSHWTLHDHQAAGQWLGSVPDGEVKNLSVRVFAETVAPFDPEIATQWALTLPAGNDREQTLQKIRSVPPKQAAPD